MGERVRDFVVVAGALLWAIMMAYVVVGGAVACARIVYN